MSLRQLTDAVTAPGHSWAHDKHVVTRTHTHTHSYSSIHTRLHKNSSFTGVLGNKLLQPLFSIYSLIFQQPQKVRSFQELTVMENIRIKRFLCLFFFFFAAPYTTSYLHGTLETLPMASVSPNWGFATHYNVLITPASQ